MPYLFLMKLAKSKQERNIEVTQTYCRCGSLIERDNSLEVGELIKP
jgi:hypothetical protein